VVVAAVGAQSVNRSLLTLKTEDNPSDPMDGARGPFSPDFAGGDWITPWKKSSFP